MMNDEADQVRKELFDSLIKKYRIGLEKSRRGRNFILDCVHLLLYVIK